MIIKYLFSWLLRSSNINSARFLSIFFISLLFNIPGKILFLYRTFIFVPALAKRFSKIYYIYYLSFWIIFCELFIQLYIWSLLIFIEYFVLLACFRKIFIQEIFYPLYNLTEEWNYFISIYLFSSFIKIWYLCLHWKQGLYFYDPFLLRLFPIVFLPVKRLSY